mmetsp:Transcript_16766/g.42959  ORF Transcript_16766/g.42959 Transcript_16766/m.42959 type:complete len:222 (-) Transcript_16766:4094-4759(-)
MLAGPGKAGTRGRLRDALADMRTDEVDPPFAGSAKELIDGVVSARAVVGEARPVQAGVPALPLARAVGHLGPEVGVEPSKPAVNLLSAEAARVLQPKPAGACSQGSGGAGLHGDPRDDGGEDPAGRLAPAPHVAGGLRQHVHRVAVAGAVVLVLQPPGGGVPALALALAVRHLGLAGIKGADPALHGLACMALRVLQAKPGGALGARGSGAGLHGDALDDV